jgi:DNA-3-methyladenine glycosylase I
MRAYHDTEWGVPLHDDRKHYEFLVLDAMQAGLSWRTVLHKREHFRRAFAGFEVGKVARFGAREVQRLLGDAGIIRNRLKIESAITNARQFLRVQDECGSFDKFIWQFVANQPIVNRWQTLRQLPARTNESDAMSRELKQRGFKFVGSTICYAYMQAAGMVNDHVVSCFRHRQVQR